MFSSSMLLLFCVTIAMTGCGGAGTTSGGSGTTGGGSGTTGGGGGTTGGGGNPGTNGYTVTVMATSTGNAQVTQSAIVTFSVSN